MFNQSAERFTEIMQGMKQMAAEMQQELETTRAELRRGILELPQETAESAAQMRRVIVDQIEALAELNRIVARHGRTLDAAEPVRREPEPAYAGGGGRAPGAADARPDITRRRRRRRVATLPARRPRTALSKPAALETRRSECRQRPQQRRLAFSDLLSRASREDEPPIAPPSAARSCAR